MPANLYLIALLPPPPLRDRVRALKEEMRDRFGASHALKSPAHITLQMPFRLGLEDEPGLLKLLEAWSRRQRPFAVKLMGFGSFPPRVIFIRIIDHNPVSALEGSLRELLAGEAHLQIETSHQPFHPHMTIATRDLREPAFYQAWAEFKDRPFEAAFEVRSLFLLRHNGQFWEIYREFNFGEGT
jgi:2'-5' RNA ligase